MTLASGTRLGPYELLAPVGAGGMGEVYRAKDTRLDRTVAVKVLPEHLSSSAESRQRFEREAKTISQLSHPHICALYDVGNQDGVEFLVMEYLEGETLSDRLLKGPLAFDQVLRYGIEMADALDKAHRQGIVHRDLKPGNVMLTKSGVKLLDFGLAKAVAVPGTASGAALTALPTQMGSNLTQEGTILGTFQYMAPEQLEGREADSRTDIFAFGCVLYEMATGRKAFSGNSQASLISSIMGSEPPAVSTIAPMTPPAFDRVVRTCLAKDADDRWQTAHDVMLELKWVAEGGSAAGLPAPVVARRRNRERVAWTAAAILFVLLSASLLLVPRKAPSAPSVLRTSVLVPEKQFIRFLTLSPNGRRLAFVAAPPGGKRSLWVRPLDGLSAAALDGTENADFPFWSPDSGSIGFFADGKLKRVDAAGGAVVTLCDTSPNGLGGTWSRDGTILFGLPSRPIHRVADSGGASEPVTKLDTSRRETTHRYPHFLPDGRHFVYLAANLAGAPDDPANRIKVGSLDGGADRPVLPASSNAVYVSGRLLFVREGNLLAQKFDPKKLATSGSPQPIAQRVAMSDFFWRWGLFSATENGLVAYSSALQTSSRLVWLDRFGREAGSVGEPAPFVSSPRLSPDGRLLAVTILDSALNKPDVWLYDLSRSVRTRLTSGPSENSVPVWSPDGSRIVFTTDRKHQGDLYAKPVTGHGGEGPFLEGEGQRFADDWSPDGRFLAVEIREPRGERRVALSVVPASGEKTPKVFFQRSTDVGEARFSPDGRWIAYTSEESGRSEVYLGAFPGPGAGFQVSPSGGGAPRWRRDGRELFYLAEDGALMAVEVRTAGAPETGVSRKLFEPHPQALDYDVSSDGQRFLIVASGAESSPPITLVQNWTAGLK
jgi:Tol biopolymer transport system component/tRNA A-37 threonylcarbamoyl transferase component Bud32